MAEETAKDWVEWAWHRAKNRSLDLWHKNICVEEAKGLAAALASGNTSLTALDLSDNRIGTEGAKAVAAALASGNTSLTTLDLENNDMNAEGVKELAAALSSGNTSLTTLGLSYNEIYVEGAKLLAAALASGKTRLTTLYLRGSNIYAEGAKLLAAALASGNTSLTTLDLHNNDIGAEGAKAVAAALASGKTRLTTLDFGDMRSEDEQLVSIELHKNRHRLMHAAHLISRQAVLIAFSIANSHNGLKDMVLQPMVMAPIVGFLAKDFFPYVLCDDDGAMNNESRKKVAVQEKAFVQKQTRFADSRYFCNCVARL